MKSWIVLLILSIYSNIYLWEYLSYLFIIVLIYKILSDLHIIGEASFGLRTIMKSEMYYLNIKGPYKNVHPFFSKTCEILAKFNLSNHYNVNKFGMYFDDPKKIKEEDCRSIIGIMINNFEHKELTDYLLTEGWTKNTLEASACIVSRLNIVHWAAFILAIKRYYKDLERKLLDQDFVKKFRLTNPDNIPCVIELYKENVIEFYVPTGSKEKFNFYVEDKQIKS